VCPLPEPSNPTFETLAAECLRSHLEAHGPPPWSICEACLGEDDYQRLCRWAATVTAPRLDDARGSAGLVLLAFVAEWNRRNSPGDSVWVGLPPLFGVESARLRLFTGNNQPTLFMYRTLRRTCERFHLRHAFAAAQEEVLRYYLSIQLQYGFSLPHAQTQLGNWLRGHRPPEVALRLLEPEGYYRSASFRRLVRDMRSYRRNYLPESDFRRTLRDNPWVLPVWENTIVALIDGIPRDDDEDEPEFRLLSDPRVTWEGGPEVWCRVCALPDRLTAPRYLLRQAGRDIARYYRNRSGAIEVDRCAAQIRPDGPEAVVTLETPDGEVVEVQTIRLWDPEVVAQVRPVGRETEEAVERLLPGEQVLITSTEAVVTPAPAVWRVLGPRERRRRWWLLEGTERVRVEDGGVVWNGEPPPPPPAWANGVSVSLEAARNFFQLGQQVRFRIDTAPGVEVAHATCASHPLSFADVARTRTSPVRVQAEMSGRCRLRVGLTRGEELAVVQREVNLPVRAVTWADDGSEIPRDKPLSCFQAMNRPVRLLSDGPAVLIEGREIFGPFPAGRVARIRRVLGTGRELIIADRPFNTHDCFRLSRSAVDTGLARSLEREGKRLRLSLFHPLLPGERHRLVLWSPGHGVEVLDASAISAEDGGRVWAFCAPWETNTLLAAVAYEGMCLASGWDGEDARFYDPHATDDLDLLRRIALIRWCRLPGLRPDPDAQKYPLIGRLTRFPLEMVRVALLDAGLPEGMGLVFDDRQSPRGELFNVIFREAYVRPTQGDMAAVFDGLTLDIFNRLMAYHPLLGCRSLQAVLRRLVQESAQQTLMLLRAMQLQLLSLTADAGSQIITRREAELLDRARITCCENGELMDENAVREGLVLPVIQHLFDDAPLGSGHEDNLRTALGVAPFRECLAARILRRLLEQLA
jgi:hypothetical protein